MSYGPWNALAEVLGAYIQKKSIDGAMDYADKFDEQISGLTQPKPEIDKSPAKVTPQVANQLVPMQGFDMGKAAGSVSTSPLANTPGLLKPMQDFAKLDPRAPQMSIAATAQPAAATQPVAPAMTPEEHAKKQAEYNAFAAAKAKNPEWYVGDTYVGADNAAKDAATKQQAEEAAKQVQRKQLMAGVHENQYGSTAFNRDSGQKEFENKFGFTGNYTQPPEYHEAVYQFKSRGAKVMQEIVKKFGVDAAKQAAPLIDQAIKDKSAQYSNEIDGRNRGVLFQTLGQLNMGDNGQRNAAIAMVSQYNVEAKKMGLEPLDMASMGQIINSGQFDFKSVNLNDKVVLMATHKNGTSIGTDPKTGKPIMSIPVADMAKGVGPDTKAKIDWDGKKVVYVQSQENARSYARNATTLQAAAIRGSGGGKTNKTDQKAINTENEKFENALKAINDDPEASGDAVNAYVDFITNIEGLDDADRTALLNRAYHLQFLREKKAGHENTAAQFAGQMTPDYWNNNLSDYGDQP